MHRIDGPGATVDNKFTEGDPVGGVQATVVTDDWLNDVQENVMAVLAAAGVSPTKGRTADLLDAIRASGTGIVGGARNARMSIATASATATFTASEVVVETALGGQAFKLANFNKSINLATIGAGGMDAGSAPVSGYVAIYAIYNPTSVTSALLAVNATAAAAPEVYGGVNMPTGYTASALVSVWPTNASGQFIVGYQEGREFFTTFASVASSSTPVASLTALNISAFAPKNARNVGGFTGVASQGNSVDPGISLAGSATAIGRIQATGGTSGATVSTQQCPFKGVPLITPQTIFWQTGVSAGTFIGANIYLDSYIF